MDKPIPWILLLVGITFFESAMSDYRDRKYRGASIFVGLALLCFTLTVVWAEISNPSALISFFHPPPLLPYGLSALIVSLTAALGWSYRRTAWSLVAYLKPVFTNLAIAAALWIVLFLMNTQTVWGSILSVIVILAGLVALAISIRHDQIKQGAQPSSLASMEMTVIRAPSESQGAESTGKEISVVIPMNVADTATITDERLAKPEPVKAAEPSGQSLKEDIVVDALNALAIKKATREAKAIQPLTSDAELATKYFNEFAPAPARRTLDYDVSYWIKLGTLYGVYNGTLGLRFLPDTYRRDEDALLLLLFGYRQIYDLKQVEARKLEQGLYLSGCRKHLPPRTGAGIVYEMVSGEGRDDRIAIDELAKSMFLHGNISEKFGLASGGFYAITDRGLLAVERLFDDLVRRA